MISFGISPDSSLIATTSDDETINVFAADTGKIYTLLVINPPEH